MATPPPHGKAFKTKVESVKGNLATFVGKDDDGDPVKITLESKYSKTVAVASVDEWAVDFRTLPPDRK
jgi:hypothetical protein